MELHNFSVTTTGATSGARIDYPGSFVYFQEITSGTTSSRIQVKTNNGDRVLLKPGQGVNMPAFRSLEITRDSGSATIAGELLVGDGDFTDNRSSGSVSVAPAATDYVPAGVTLTNASAQVLAANSNRKYLLIQNQSSTDDAYFHTAGGVAVGDKTCVKIAAGGTWEPPVPPTGQINGIRSAAAAANVDCHVIEG